MKLIQLFVTEQTSPALLYLLIILAGIDYQSILDYGIKATLGSAVWFAFRVLGDYYSTKIKRSINHSKEEKK